MNKAIIIGRLTGEPEHKTTSSGISVATFSVAVTRRMNREEADYINVVVWRGLADNCVKYLSKGQQVAVFGELRTRSYEDRNGVRRYVTEIHAEDVEFLAKPMKQTKNDRNITDHDGMKEIDEEDMEVFPF